MGITEARILCKAHALHCACDSNHWACSCFAWRSLMEVHARGSRGKESDSLVRLLILSLLVELCCCLDGASVTRRSSSFSLWPPIGGDVTTWLILPVVICL